MDRLIRYNSATDILVVTKSIKIIEKGSLMEFAANGRAGENSFLFY
jgi:hypothetical protein